MRRNAPVVVSLFDYTGEAVKPWAEDGYRCLCFDLQHPPGPPRIVKYPNGGSIEFHHWDSDIPSAKSVVRFAVGRRKPAIVFGFPPCDDLAVSGAKHWAKKLEADPLCQIRAANRAKLVAKIADEYGSAYVVENPRGALGRLWRPKDHSFNPNDYGGYIPLAEAAHPTWPEYIPDRDAYTKVTNLWTGNGFVMPDHKRVAPIIVEFDNGKKGSPQWAKLGGKSLKTKNIRSATPRGFARAVKVSNSPIIVHRKAA